MSEQKSASRERRVARRPRRSADETRRRLVAFSRELFAREGYERVSTRTIAQQADVPERLIYRYFGSKQELFQAAVSERLHEFAQSFTEEWTPRLVEGASLEAVTQPFVITLVEELTALRPLLLDLLLLTDGGRATLAAGVSVSHAFKDVFEHVLANTQKNADRLPWYNDQMATTLRFVFGVALSTVLFDGILFGRPLSGRHRRKVIDELVGFVTQAVKPV